MSDRAPEIYADHAATTPVAPEVLEAMRPFHLEHFGNPSSVHSRGEHARQALVEARDRVAALVGSLPEEVVFTASGSEANNLALKGAMLAAASGRRRMVVSGIEHPSVLETARHLEGRGFELTIVPAEPSGVVPPARIRDALGGDVALVSVMLANNETGVLQPVAEIAALAREAGALMHTDAVQAVGKIPVSLPGLGVDLLSLAGHKFHGPAGAAALIVRRRTRLSPLIHGGHQERSRRAGTENLPALVGLGAAAVRAGRRLADDGPRLAALADRLLEGLRERIPGVRLHGDAPRLPGLLNVGFEGVDGEAVLHELDREGIIVSTGSACSAASPGPSHVLLSMGLSPEAAHASVRFSLGGVHHAADIERMLGVVPGVVARLRALSGAGTGSRD